MCLHVVIAPVDGRPIAAATGIAAIVSTPRGRGALELTPRGECGCGFGVGDLPGGVWTVRDDLREPLARMVEAVAQSTKRFRLTATWVGRTAPTEVALTVAEAVERIRAGEIAEHCLLIRGGR